jgi:hypothetical protein
MESAPPSSEFTVRVSYVEIYLEKILDLLNPEVGGRRSRGRVMMMMMTMVMMMMVMMMMVMVMMMMLLMMMMMMMMMMMIMNPSRSDRPGPPRSHIVAVVGPAHPRGRGAGHLP